METRLLLSLLANDVDAIGPTAIAGDRLALGADQALAPNSSVTPLPLITTTESFKLNWTGSAGIGGSAIATYDVFVSTDGGPFVPLMTTTATTTDFQGVFGHSYGFFSVATDQLGVRQAIPASPQAITTVTDATTLVPTRLTDVAATGTYAGSATLTATLTAGGLPLAGKMVAFALSDGETLTIVGSAATNDDGVAMLTGVDLAGFNAGLVPGAIGAVFAGDEGDTASTAGGALTVVPVTVTLNLGGLAATYDGAPHAALATTDPPGLDGVSITYTRDGETVTSPTDAGSYTVVAALDNPNAQAASVTGTLVIDQATPIITWAQPADIPYGTLLNSGQLNARSSVPGTFAYTPGTGAILNAGAGQVLSATFSPTDSLNFRSVTVTNTLNVLKGKPTITWASPADITYGTPLGASQFVATAGYGPLALTGTFVDLPGVGTVLDAGPNQTLTVRFIPTDTIDFENATATVPINVLPAPLTVTVDDATKVYGQPFPSFSVRFDGFVHGDNAGALGGTLTFGTSANPVSDVGTYDVTGGGLASNNYAIHYVNATLTVTPADQSIVWSVPDDIVYGTPLDDSQLDATVAVVGPAPAGTSTYSPTAGTILKAGAGQPLTVVAMATLDYKQATATVSLNVLKATPTITWANPGDLPFGAALGAAQLDAKATLGGVTLAGTFAYSPSAGSVLHGGSGQTLSVVFTPDDSADLNSVTATAQINVTPAVPVFGGLAAPKITYGDAASTLEGHLTAGTLIPPGSVAITLDGVTELAPIDPTHGTFSATFPTARLGASTSPYTVTYAFAGSTDFAPVDASTRLTVNKANQTIAWPAPAAIGYGTPLDATQLDARVSVGGPDPSTGALTYTPAAGTILHAGPGQPLTVNAAATANYNAASLTVTIDVEKAMPIVSTAIPGDIVYGTRLHPNDVLSPTAAIPGTFTFVPGDGAILDAGQDQILVTFTPADLDDYFSVQFAAPINVERASLTVTANDATMVAGQKLPTFSVREQGFATGDGPADLGGALRFSVPAGAAGAAGTYPITPGGLTSANYQIIYINGTLTVAPKPVPTVTVLDVRWQARKKAGPGKVLVVTYSGALDPGHAQDLGAYRLVAAGRDKRFGTRDDKVKALTSATYAASTRTVTLTPRSGVPNQGLQLSISTSLTLDALGRPIVGNRQGQSGNDFVTVLGGRGVQNIHTARPDHTGAVSANAFDTLMATGHRPTTHGLRRGPHGRGSAISDRRSAT